LVLSKKINLIYQEIIGFYQLFWINIPIHTENIYFEKQQYSILSITIKNILNIIWKIDDNVFNRLLD